MPCFGEKPPMLRQTEGAFGDFGTARSPMRIGAILGTC